MADAEGCSTFFVVVFLIVTVSVVAEDVVHRDVIPLSLTTDVADEVHRCMCAGVIDHLETLQCDALLGLSGSEGDAVVLSCPGGEGTTQQDDGHGSMDKQCGRPLPHLSLYDRDDSSYGHQGHQHSEPPRAVEVVAHPIRPMIALKNGACGQYDGHKHH